MSMSDEEFLREYHPLHIPARYNPADSLQDRVLYGLAQVGEGTPEDIGIEIAKLDTSVEPEGFSNTAAEILHHLFDKGLIKGEEKDGVMHYDLSKITHENGGGVK